MFVLIYIYYLYLRMKRGSAASKSNIMSVMDKPGVSQDQIKQIKEVFDLFDPEGRGQVRPKELKDALDSLGNQAKAQTLYQMISDLCEDGTVYIGLEQFLDMMTSRISQKDSRQNIRKVFNLFDEEKTGFISIKNLRKITKELGDNVQEHELQEMIDKADLDHDGLISEEEFYLIITKKN